jgi:hypothetical protein
VGVILVVAREDAAEIDGLALSPLDPCADGGADPLVGLMDQDNRPGGRCLGRGPVGGAVIDDHNVAHNVSRDPLHGAADLSGLV